MTIKDLVKQSYEGSKAKGWYEKPRTFGDRIALCHSELSEALEEYRAWGDEMGIYFSPEGKPEGVAIELADVVIRIADMCGDYVIDLEEAIRIKLKYNDTRPHRHGGKRL